MSKSTLKIPLGAVTQGLRLAGVPAVRDRPMLVRGSRRQDADADLRQASASMCVGAQTARVEHLMRPPPPRSCERAPTAASLPKRARKIETNTSLNS